MSGDGQRTDRHDLTLPLPVFSKSSNLFRLLIVCPLEVPSISRPLFFCGLILSPSVLRQRCSPNVTVTLISAVDGELKHDASVALPTYDSLGTLYDRCGSTRLCLLHDFDGQLLYRIGSIRSRHESSHGGRTGVEQY